MIIITHKQKTTSKPHDSSTRRSVSTSEVDLKRVLFPHDSSFITAKPKPKRLRFMGVEVVRDKVPTDGRRIGFDRAMDVVDKVFLGPCRAIGWLYDTSGCHFKVDHENMDNNTTTIKQNQLPSISLWPVNNRNKVIGHDI